MSLQSCVAEIADVLRAHPESGLAEVHAGPPERLGTYPCAWVNHRRGDVNRAASDAMWTHEIDLVVYVAPRVANLPAEYALVAPLVSSIERVIWLAYLGTEFSGSLSACLVQSYEIGLVPFAGKDQHAITFRLWVKEHTT